MKYITDLTELKDIPASVITLGKFDGVHRGHQKLIRLVQQLGQENGWSTVVFTFNISPQVSLGLVKSPMLMTNTERRIQLEQMNMDYLVECPFTDEIRNMEPETFIEEILCGRLHARALVVGRDFHFGRRRRGDTQMLLELGPRLGMEVHVEPKEKDGDREISSTYVREELSLGHMEKVRELLGGAYSVRGTIVHGNHLGHSIGFPTINQIPETGKLLPPNGVYLSRTTVDDMVYSGISNVGTKPTVEGNRLGIETYLFDFDGNLYGKEAAVELLSFRRAERKFSSLEELKAQLQKDIGEARELFVKTPVVAVHANV